jgi:DNA polymerase III subunit beta
MTQTAPKQRLNSAKQSKQTSAATSKIEPTENEAAANGAETPVGKKKKPASPNADTPTASSNKRTKKRSTKSKLKSQPLIESGMEVVCEQTKFFDALFLVSCATPAKPTHPILANVLMIADVATQQIHLTVTDLALTIQASFEAQVLLKGEITVPVQILLEIVKHCPNSHISLNSQIQMTQLADDDQQSKVYSLGLSDADGKYEIRGMGAEEFPPTHTIDATPISLPTTGFKDGLKGVIYAVSTDENKYILTGVHIQLAQEKLKFIGTDGHRVATTEVSTQGIGRKSRKQVASSEIIQFTIPGRVLKELARNLDDAVECIHLLYDAQSHRLGFAWQDIMLKCQCLEGTYPDCEQLLAKFSFDQEVVIEKALLVKALERLAVLTDKKEKGIYLQFDGAFQQLRLSIEREFGKGDQVVVAHLPPEMSLNIQFNLKYLVEAAKAIPSSAIKIHLQQSDHPAMLVPYGDRPNPKAQMSMRQFLLPLYNSNG